MTTLVLLARLIRNEYLWSEENLHFINNLPMEIIGTDPYKYLSLRDYVNHTKGLIMGLFGKRRIFDPVEKVTGAHTFHIQGKSIVCPQCGSDRFELGSALLNTAGMTFMNLDWANRQASVLTCTMCTHIQWFLRQPEITG